jgi:murein DD-endopeptidase MepM/ murein hydrolase activator NlpD
LQTSQLPQPAPAASTVVAGGGRGMASYAPPAAPYNPPVTPVVYSPSTQAAYSAPPSTPTYSTASFRSAPAPAPATEITGSVTAPNSVVRKPAPSGQWSWDGGTAVTVAPGETLDSIARRHGVPASAIMQANNLASPNALQAGQRLVIPRYIPPLSVPAAPAPPPGRVAQPSAPLAPKPAPVMSASPAPPPAGAAAAANSGMHVVAPGDTLTKIAHHYGKSVAEIVKANNIPPSGKLSIGDRIVIPGSRIGTAKSEAERAAATAPAQPGAKAAAGAAPAQSASMVAADDSGSDGAAKATDATPGFRWPARGRVIAGFGPKPNGQQNDGIDVAVPENTPIKAAEDGVVAYAGNELKGYGNLVLVRHPNGYVTAYAHAKELLVKRGDPIKRGEVIAKSGQTGNVDVPELHFEVRKGTVPVDPMPFLNGA